MLYHYNLCKKLSIQENDFNTTMTDIREAVVNNNRDRRSLKQFYENFLNELTINSNKIYLIKLYLLIRKNKIEKFLSLYIYKNIFPSLSLALSISISLSLSILFLLSVSIFSF